MPVSILSKPPEVVAVKDINLPEVIHSNTSNDIPVYEIRKAGSGIIKLEFVFVGGRTSESKKMTSATCAGLMREGAGPWSSKQLADYVGYYGASLEVHASLDTITIQLVCLKKYLNKFIRPLSYILSKPTFAERELKAFVKRRNQKLKVELNKNDVVSYRQLTEAIFGPNHPYGYNSTPELYRQIEQNDLFEYFGNNLHAGHCMVFAAGDIEDEDFKTIREMTTLVSEDIHIDSFKEPMLEPSKQQKFRLQGSINQSSIKIGRRLFSRKHPDHVAMSFLNTLLGGFFGSRLVTALREKEGLTYGVYSNLDTLIFDGMMMVSTEVSNNNVDKSIRLIYDEFERLQNDLVSVEELDHVRNYVMGIILHLFDGPFNSIRAIKSLALSGIPTGEIKSLIQISQTINPQEILALAQKYLDRIDFWEIVVGTHSQNT